MALVSKATDISKPKDGDNLTPEESAEIVELVQKTSTPKELKKLEKIIKQSDTSLTNEQAELFANFLTSAAGKVVPSLVQEAGKTIKKIETGLTTLLKSTYNALNY